MKTPRLFIYAADLMRIYGKSERTCRRLLQTMKEHFGLGKRQNLTYFQLGEFLNLPVDQLFPYIRVFSFVIAWTTP